MPLNLAPLRILVGTVFAVGGLRAVATVDATTRSFAAWHIPNAPVAAPALAATAIVCGILLALGALTRPVALLLATMSIGMFVTAGRYGGAIFLAISPPLFLACVFFAWRSARFGSAPPRPPGVQ